MSHGIMCGAYNIKYQYPITLIRQGDRLQQLGPEQHRLSPLLGLILHIGPRLLSGPRQKPEGGSMPDSSRRAEDHMPWRTSLTMLHPPLLCLWTHTHQQSPHIYNSKRTRSDTRSCVGRGHHLPSWLPCRPLLLQHRGTLKTFLAHPSVFLLHVFTHFAFAYNSKGCCGGPGGKKEETYVAGTLIHSGILLQLSVNFVLLIFLLPMTSLGVLTTLVFTFSNQCTCCKNSYLSEC